MSQGQMGVLFGTTVVNSLASMWKDSAYAKMFGATTKVGGGGLKPSIPTITYGLWGLRDCMVVGSSFILPELTSQVLQEHVNGLSEKDALRISQIVCPITTQLIAGPIQLLGLDYYNRPLTNMTFQRAVLERINFQFHGFTSIVSARIARILPAYGICGVGNTQLRTMWRDGLMKK